MNYGKTQKNIPKDWNVVGFVQVCFISFLPWTDKEVWAPRSFTDDIFGVIWGNFKKKESKKENKCFS